MKEVTEMMIYDMAFRVRLYIAAKLSEEKRVNDLSDREALLLELIGTKGEYEYLRSQQFLSEGQQQYDFNHHFKTMERKKAGR